MFIIRAPQEVYFNKFSIKDMSYNITKYYKNSNFHYFRENFDSHYFKDSFFYYINNKKQFHDVHENKSSKRKEKKI